MKARQAVSLQKYRKVISKHFNRPLQKDGFFTMDKDQDSDPILITSSAHIPFRRSDSRRNSAISSYLIGVIEEGTNMVSFAVYTTPDFKKIASHQQELQMISTQDGWFEQEPMEMIEAIYTCCEAACKQLEMHGYSAKSIVSIGITNQRETTVVWDTLTGKPLYNALVWNDMRSSTVVDRLLAKLPDKSKNFFKDIAGLPLSPYFSAPKIRWLKDNVPAIRKACREKHCKAGTVDSWIVWNLTKGSSHVTDVTNASRTLLMNIETLHWDPVLLKAFSIHKDMLPEIRSCSEVYGSITDERCILHGVAISGIVGNQQASLLGQMCIKPGQAKNSYRSGCFLLCNTGEQCVISPHGLITTIAYKMGPKAPTHYALEGAVAIAGHALQWLEEKFRLIAKGDDIEELANDVHSTGGVYFVPAFTGLYAPYWRKEARGIICGLTQYTTKKHIIRATLESICYQTNDILECMLMETGFRINKLYVDGPLTSKNLLMQLQADIAGIPVLRTELMDVTSFGAAMCAAQADGINLCSFEPGNRCYENSLYETFLPTSTDNTRHQRYSKWKKTVERSMGWVMRGKAARVMPEQRHKLLGSVPAGVFLIGSFILLVLSVAKSS